MRDPFRYFERQLGLFLFFFFLPFQLLWVLISALWGRSDRLFR